MQSHNLSNEGRPSISQRAVRPSELKPYRTPTLAKGPVLSAITADTAVSGKVF